MNLTVEEAQLLAIYRQISDSGQYSFPNSVESRTHTIRVLDGIRANGESTPLGIECVDGADYRQYWIDHYLPIKRELEELCRSWGAELPHVFVGPMNDGSLNMTLRTMHIPGALVLYNDGLKSFFYQAVKVVVGNCALGDYLDRDDIPQHFSKAEANEILHHVLHFTNGGDARGAPPSPILPGHQMSIVMSAVESCDRFVIAHELGHLVEESSIGGLESEYSADEFAFEAICDRQKRRMVERTENDFVGVQAEVFAPLLFFEVMFIRRLYDAICRMSPFVDYHDHPPDLLRRDRLVQRLMELGKGIDFYQSLSSVLDHFYQYLLSEAERRCAERGDDFDRDAMRIRCDMATESWPLPNRLTASHQRGHS